MFQFLKQIWVEFSRDEEGLALTEYLILLGIMTTAVIIMIVSIGGSINTAWAGWAEWFKSL